jgi:predicted enzyme related to lactoylglutathione lyase
MADPVVYFEIVGGDAEQQQTFYADLFGWTLAPVESTGGAYARAAAADAGLEGGVGAFPGAPNYVTVYVRAKDPAAALARAHELGGTTLMEPREVREGVTVAMFRDPAGNAVGLISGV